MHGVVVVVAAAIVTLTIDSSGIGTGINDDVVYESRRRSDYDMARELAELQRAIDRADFAPRPRLESVESISPRPLRCLVARRAPWLRGRQSRTRARRPRRRRLRVWERE